MLQVSGSHLRKHKKWLWKIWQVWPKTFKILCFLEELNIKVFFGKFYIYIYIYIYIYLRIHFLKAVLQNSYSDSIWNTSSKKLVTLPNFQNGCKCYWKGSVTNMVSSSMNSFKRLLLWLVLKYCPRFLLYFWNSIEDFYKSSL